MRRRLFFAKLVGLFSSLEARDELGALAHIDFDDKSTWPSPDESVAEEEEELDSASPRGILSDVERLRATRAAQQEAFAELQRAIDQQAAMGAQAAPQSAPGVIAAAATVEAARAALEREAKQEAAAKEVVARKAVVKEVVEKKAAARAAAATEAPAAEPRTVTAVPEWGSASSSRPGTAGSRPDSGSGSARRLASRELREADALDAEAVLGSKGAAGVAPPPRRKEAESTEEEEEEERAKQVRTRLGPGLAATVPSLPAPARSPAPLRPLTASDSRAGLAGTGLAGIDAPSPRSSALASVASMPALIPRVAALHLRESTPEAPGGSSRGAEPGCGAGGGLLGGSPRGASREGVRPLSRATASPLPPVSRSPAAPPAVAVAERPRRVAAVPPPKGGLPKPKPFRGGGKSGWDVVQ